MIRERLETVRSRIAAASAKRGGGGAEITLVCVTKGVALPLIEEAISCGINEIGENRVQEAVLKHGVLGSRVRWHLIGHLQTNKAKEAVGVFSLIHSLDSGRLAREIDAQAGKAGKVQEVLVEVNISGEAQKYGVAPGDTLAFIEKVAGYPHLAIRGLMGMAPLAEDPERARPYFRQLKALFDRIGAERSERVVMKHLSMGMSQDYEVAIEEGATMVRVGSAIFH